MKQGQAGHLFFPFDFVIIYIEMELGNNAIQIFRENIELTHMQMRHLQPSTRCLQEFSRLSDCIMSNKLNILDKDST